MPQRETTFQPNELWTPDVHEHDPVLRQAVEETTHEIDSINTDQYKDLLSEQVRTAEDGSRMGVMDEGQPDKYSSEEAIVMFVSAANTLTPNHLMRGDYIRRVAEKTGATDEEGKPLPVMVLPSPGIGGNGIHFTREQRQQIRSGDMGVYAKELLDRVAQREVGRVSITGFSQGADSGMAAANQARAANLDVRGVAVGDPAGVEDRGMLRLGRDFGQATDLSQAQERSGLRAQEEFMDTKDAAKFSASLLSRVNISALLPAIAKDRFIQQLQTALEEGAAPSITVAYGDKSTITKPEAIEPGLQELQSTEAGQEILTTIKAMDADHTWGDELPRIAALFDRAVR